LVWPIVDTIRVRVPDSVMSDAFIVAAIATVGVAMIAYNLAVVTRAHGGGDGRSLHAVIIDGGASFIAKHLERDDAASSVLAVQSLRNTILVAIFIGGIAFQAFQTAAVAAGAATDAVSSARSLVFSAFLLGSFLNFALVIRAASHLAYILGGAHFAAAGDAAEEGRGVGAPPPHSSSSRAAAAVCASLMRALSLHFSLGFRCLYASVPFAYAASGPVALVVSGGAMLGFLVYADFALHAGARAFEDVR
jgi:hypothetical protein